MWLHPEWCQSTPSAFQDQQEAWGDREAAERGELAFSLDEEELETVEEKSTEDTIQQIRSINNTHAYLWRIHVDVWQKNHHHIVK